MEKNIQDTFGFKWENFPKTNEEWVRSNAVERIERNGWEVDAFKDWINGKRVLDAGCGMGWYTDFLSAYNPDGKVYGVDIAIKAIKKGLELGNGCLLVGDIANLPFPDETFDYIACEEVIHHTPNPEQTLNHLVSKVKSGGTYTMYIYKEKPLLRELADKNIRKTTTQMSIEECLEFSRKMTELGKALYEVDETIDVPEIELLGIDSGTYTVHEFVYRHFLKCFFNWETGDEQTSIATNFDWYHPEYAYRYTETEVREMVTNVGLEIEYFQKLMSGYSVRAKKPDHSRAITK